MDNYLGYLVSRWDQRFWNQVYGKIKSVDGRLEIISSKLNLTSMPLLKDKSKKAFYLMDLEDKYWKIEFDKINP